MKPLTSIGFTQRLLLTVLIGSTISVVLYLIAQLVAPIDVFAAPATCLSDRCFCEAHSGIFPEQVANSLSSFAFIYLGVWTLMSTREPVVGSRERHLKPVFGVILLFLGASSFLYHATLSFFGQFLDIFSMYTFGVLLAVGALYRSGKLRAVTAALIFFLVNLGLAVLQFNYPEARRILFAALLLPGIVLEVLPTTTAAPLWSFKSRFIYWGIAIMVFAYVIWNVDQIDTICDPSSVLQGHAVWHVLSAIAAFMIVLHYRETPHRNTGK